MQVWNVLHAAHWKCRTQKVVKNLPSGTITHLCRAISWQQRHVSTIGKKNLLNSNVSPTYRHNMVNLQPTSGWDLLASLGHPSKFQRVLHLGSITARHCSSGRQSKFTALNRRRLLHLAGRPSCWALAHILVEVHFRQICDSDSVLCKYLPQL